MNRHRMHRTLLLLSIFLGLAIAPWARAENLPSTIKAASDATPYTTNIQQFVDRQLKDLVALDKAPDNPDTPPPSVAGARTTLVAQLASSSPQPSASFFDVYAGVVNQALLKFASSKKLTVRLNAAIICAQVAKPCGGNVQLAASTEAFMLDKNEAVAIWGLKAAKYVLPTQLGVLPQLRKNDLLPNVVTVVKNHPTSAAIIDEAYKTLTLETSININGLPESTIEEVIPQVQKLLETRTTLYSDEAPPVYLGIDTEATIFLTRSRVWKVQTNAQQSTTLDDMYGLSKVMVKLITANPPIPDREDLLLIFHQVGKTFQVVADNRSDPALRKVGEQMDKIAPSAPDTDFLQLIDSLHEVLQKKNSTAGNLTPPN